MGLLTKLPLITIPGIIGGKALYDTTAAGELGTPKGMSRSLWFEHPYRKYLAKSYAGTGGGSIMGGLAGILMGPGGIKGKLLAGLLGGGVGAVLGANARAAGLLGREGSGPKLTPEIFGYGDVYRPIDHTMQLARPRPKW